jgi:hypothetical protein
MSLLADLQDDLQAASAAVAHAERTATLYPDVPSVLATLRTIEAHRRSLEEQFAAAANDLGLDICSYRIEFDDRRRATIASLTAALGTFQKVFTSVFDALTNGAKQRARTVSDYVLDATSFGFGYTFPGSVGFMMTLANERILMGPTKLDDAMKATLALISVRDPERVQAMTEDVGLVSVRLAHQWALENSKGHLGADISWQRQEEVKLRLRLQPQEIIEVAGSIGAAIAQEQVQVIGELLHVNVFEHTFEMIAEGKRISGTFSRAISESNPAKLPKQYLATLTINTKVALVDGEEQVSYFLVSLDEPPLFGASSP